MPQNTLLHRTAHRIVLVGNPNVGKSSLFSRLTGTKVISGNYPGTTLSVTRGTVTTRNNVFELIDIPGIYSLSEKTELSERGANFIVEKASLLINVIDATKLKRNLYLTEQLIATGYPLVIALNFWDEAQYRGIYIDYRQLAQRLSCPVIPVVGVTGSGSAQLVTALEKQALIKAETPIAQRELQQQFLAAKEQLPDWQKISSHVKAVQTTKKREKTITEHIATLMLAPFWGACIAIIILASTLATVFLVSNGIESITYTIFDYFLTPLLLHLHKLVSFSPFLQSFLVGTVSGETINFETAMGLLSTGLYIPLGQVGPPVFTFYLFMGLLEDCGYLPRLAVLADNIMHRYALHGFALVPMVLGAGCNVTGIIGTRVLENKRQRIITAALLSMTIPCASQTGFIAAMMGKMGGYYTALLFSVLALTWHLLGTLLGAQEQHDYQELFIEIPPLRLPRLWPSVHKLTYRVKNFLRDAIPITIAGIAVLLLLNYFSLIEWLGIHCFSFLHRWWGLPIETIPALFMGLFRKEIALSFLKMIPDLTSKQAFTATLLLTLWFPCISVYTIMYKEFGGKTLARLVALMFIVSTTIGALANFLLTTS